MNPVITHNSRFQDQLRVIIASGRKSYVAGDWVEGVAIFEPQESLAPAGVQLEFRGEENIQWRAITAGSSQKTVPISDTFTIFRTRLTIFGYGPKSGKTTQMERGLYVWPFRFQLPEGSNLTPSGSYTFGNVAYFVQVTVKLTATNSIKSRLKIRVIDPRSAENVYASAVQLKPSSAEASKEIRIPLACCCCSCLWPCAQGTVDLRLTAPSGEVCAGNTLALTLQVNNDGKRRVYEIQTDLVEVVSYRTRDGKARTESVTKLLSHTFDGVSERGEWATKQLAFRVPHNFCPTPSFKGVLMSGKFFLQVRLHCYTKHICWTAELTCPSDSYQFLLEMYQYLSMCTCVICLIVYLCDFILCILQLFVSKGEGTGERTL